MSELTYMLLKFGFLALMWVFVFGVVYALRADLFGQRVRRVVARAREEQVSSGRSSSERGETKDVGTAPAIGDRVPKGPTPKRLVITEGPKAGLEIELPEEELTIGRSADSGLIIRDDFTSSTGVQSTPPSMLAERTSTMPCERPGSATKRMSMPPGKE